MSSSGRRPRRVRLLFLLLFCYVAGVVGSPQQSSSSAALRDASDRVAAPSVRRKLRKCTELHRLEYFCDFPEIDIARQQPKRCNSDNSVTLSCHPIAGVLCKSDTNITDTFEIYAPSACFYNAHKYHSTALLLSIFTGILGFDRFYLGYYAIGLAKLFTLGGLFFFYIADVILIALQQLGPADGTGYIISFYGPRVQALRFDSDTYNAVYQYFE